MNLARMKHFAAIIGKMPEEIFDMQAHKWLNYYSPIAWAAEDPKFISEGFHLAPSRISSSCASPAYTVGKKTINSSDKATMAFFGITEEQHEYLFDSSGYVGYDGHHSRIGLSHVIERVKEFIESNGVVPDHIEYV